MDLLIFMLVVLSLMVSLGQGINKRKMEKRGALINDIMYKLKEIASVAHKGGTVDDLSFDPVNPWSPAEFFPSHSRKQENTHKEISFEPVNPGSSFWLPEQENTHKEGTVDEISFKLVKPGSSFWLPEEENTPHSTVDPVSSWGPVLKHRSREQENTPHFMPPEPPSFTPNYYPPLPVVQMIPSQYSFNPYAIPAIANPFLSYGRPRSSKKNTSYPPYGHNPFALTTLKRKSVIQLAANPDISEDFYGPAPSFGQLHYPIPYPSYPLSYLQNIPTDNALIRIEPETQTSQTGNPFVYLLPHTDPLGVYKPDTDPFGVYEPDAELTANPDISSDFYGPTPPFVHVPLAIPYPLPFVQQLPNGNPFAGYQPVTEIPENPEINNDVYEAPETFGQLPIPYLYLPQSFPYQAYKQEAELTENPDISSDFYATAPPFVHLPLAIPYPLQNLPNANPFAHLILPPDTFVTPPHPDEYGGPPYPGSAYNPNIFVAPPHPDSYPGPIFESPVYTPHHSTYVVQSPGSSKQYLFVPLPPLPNSGSYNKYG